MAACERAAARSRCSATASAYGVSAPSRSYRYAGTVGATARILPERGGRERPHGATRCAVGAPPTWRPGGSGGPGLVAAAHAPGGLLLRHRQGHVAGGRRVLRQHAQAEPVDGLLD